MRIVGGKHAGRDLTSPGDKRVRPTAEHMRSALLDFLRPDLPDARVLDLYAGTGALALEALSRGAKYADFVEWGPASLHALKANIAALKYLSKTRIFKHDAIHFADALPADRYDLAFCDPPYDSKQLDWIVRIWQENRFSRILAVEHAVTHEIPPGHSTITSGDTRFTIYRHIAEGDLNAPAPRAISIPDPWAKPAPAFRPRTTRRPSSRRR
jgi:16S rRNA (guanine966-N2)-methyltransferase